MRALVAFDLDGVLYSSAPFLGAAYRDAIARVNVQRPGAVSRAPTTREILDHVGWPVPLILERLFGAIDPSVLELLASATLVAICARVHRGEGRLFPGVAATLPRLARAGFVLAVASNGRRPYVEAVLSTHHLAAHFAPLLTVDGEGPPRAKADLLRAYAARYGIDAARLVMVGDRASDVDAAAAVGCRFVGCDYGHGYRGEIAGAGPVVSAFDRLPDAIAACLAGGAPQALSKRRPER